MSIALASARRRVSFKYVAPSLAPVLILCIANGIALPSFSNPTYWPQMLATMAPLALIAMASTPAFLVRGIDLSISPLVVVVNIVIVKYLLPHEIFGGILLMPVAVLAGAVSGLVIGAAIAVLRIPSVLVTLSALFVLTGLAQSLLSTPITAGPSWLDNLAGMVGPVPGAVLTVGIPLIVWKVVEKSPYGVAVRAVGDSDTAAMSAGVDVTRVRLIAYTAGGALAGCAAIAYTALARSADSSSPAQFTVLALAAVALGGTSMTGGRGGLGLSVLGAAMIFLIQTLLNATHVSVFYLDLAYGGALVLAVMIGGRALVMKGRAR